jgi:Skp family chaperone for outer membrane proteins
MNIFDTTIENIFKKYLHKKRDYYINKALNKFIKKHNPDPKVINELKILLETEALRLYPMADKSILRERIKRARVVFIITAILSIILAIILIVLTKGTALILITPLFSALFAWIATLATIPIGYDQRIKGGMDSVIAVFEEKLMKENNLNVENEVKNFQNEKMQQEIDELKNLVKTLHNKNEHMQQEIEIFKNIAIDSNEKIQTLSDQINTLIKNQPKLEEAKLSTDCATTSPAINKSKQNHIHFQFWNQPQPKSDAPTSNIATSDTVTDSSNDKWHQKDLLINCKA